MVPRAPAEKCSIQSEGYSHLRYFRDKHEHLDYREHWICVHQGARPRHRMVDSEVGKLMISLEYFYVGFFIPLPEMSLASHRLNAITCPMTEPPALRGRIISHQMKEKHIPVYTTTMEPPMMGTS